MYMKDHVNLYELMHAFWKENTYEPFAASEIALFFFLLNIANGRHWKMPIKCSTTLISGSIKVSRQTVITARAKLRCRGLISFTEGSRNGEIPSYSINLDCKKWQADQGELKETPLHERCKDLTANLPPSSTPDLTVELTPDLTHLNNKDKRLVVKFTKKP